MTNVLFDFFVFDLGNSFRLAFEIAYFGLYIIIPVAIFVFLAKTWTNYVRLKFIEGKGQILLEIKIPKEITKSPAAMEIFFSQIHSKGSPDHLIETYVDGAIPGWHSLEIVSIEGNLKFFIWTWPKNKDTIEAQLYAQYPDIEIHEVDEDYTSGVSYDLNKYIMWGGHFTLSKPDPYPIKTYIDYGMDKDPKEEFKIDPMSAMIEYLGSLRKGEQAWVQILIQGHGSRGLTDGFLFKKPDWTKEAKKLKEELLEEFTPDPDAVGFKRVPLKSETEPVEAIERSMSKFAFDTGIRAMYIAEKESFNPTHIGGLTGSFRQYSSNTLNGFKVGWGTKFKYPWQDFRDMRKNKFIKMVLDAYKRRSFFQVPYKHFKVKPFILTTEELATIFHFPSGVISTPGIEKITSKRSDAPSNLPI